MKKVVEKSWWLEKFVGKDVLRNVLLPKILQLVILNDYQYSEGSQYFRNNYNYNTYVTWRRGYKMEANCKIYSSELFMCDPAKYNVLSKNHFGDEAHYWNNRKPSKIEGFLCDYTGDENLKLIMIKRGRSQRSGYPFWLFHYYSKIQIPRVWNP